MTSPSLPYCVNWGPLMFLQAASLIYYSWLLLDVVSIKPSLGFFPCLLAPEYCMWLCNMWHVCTSWSHLTEPRQKNYFGETLLICTDVVCPWGALLNTRFIDFPTKGNCGTRGQTPTPLRRYSHFNRNTMYNGEQATKCNITMYSQCTSPLRSNGILHRQKGEKQLVQNEDAILI